MSNIIKQISTRAKQIRKKHPAIKWQTAIKQASRELKGKSNPVIKKAGKKKSKVKVWQTGTSVTVADRKRKAKPPGKRLSKKGKVYYERRKNRSDKPGMLSGISSTSLKTALRNRLEDKLGKEFVRKTKAATKTAKRKIQKAITATKTELRKLK